MVNQTWPTKLTIGMVTVAIEVQKLRTAPGACPPPANQSRAARRATCTGDWPSSIVNAQFSLRVWPN
jgi:hypothetical protein